MTNNYRLNDVNNKRAEIDREIAGARIALITTFKQISNDALIFRFRFDNGSCIVADCINGPMIRLLLASKDIEIIEDDHELVI